MIGAEIFGMFGSSAVPATLPTLIAQWHMSSAEAGWLNGAYFIGYAAAVPLLVTITDRIDARWVFVVGCGIGIAANALFATLAHDALSAAVIWAFSGVSLAGIYMPGLRILTDRVTPDFRLRTVPYYTASFGVGVSASFFVAGLLAQNLGWRAAFVAGSAGCVIALAALVVATVATTSHRVLRNDAGLPRLAAVFENREVMRFMIGYAGHCWELFGLRAWLVAFLVFVWNRTIREPPGNNITVWSAIIALAGVPASIIGAEWALRIPRKRLILVVAASSATIAVTIGIFGTQYFGFAAIGLVIYSIFILGDSGALTTGLVQSATPGAEGSTLAAYSLVGFASGALGPIVVGLALGYAGGMTSPTGWTAALCVMGAGSALVALMMLSRVRKTETL